MGEHPPAVLALADAVRDGLGGRDDFADVPAAAYGAVLLLSAIAYYILQGADPRDRTAPTRHCKTALGTDLKGKASPILYATAIVIAFMSRWVAIAIYVLVALIWLVPDKRIESIYDELEPSDPEPKTI